MTVWDIELLLARDVRDRRALARDVERAIARRLRHGVYALEVDVVHLAREEQHILAIRAAALASDRKLVFSHWSAAVLHDLATVGNHLGTVHVTFGDQQSRGLQGVSSHVFGTTEDEIVELHGLLVTGVGRTVVDVAGSGTFEEGVVVADAALRAGVPRAVLEDAIDRAGPRRAAPKITKVVGFADGDSGSAGESLSRVSMDRLGLRPVLQHRHHDHRGFIGRSDFFFPVERVVGEFDGRVKFVDPRFAPNGAAEVLWNEKVREDRMRAVNKGFGRWGWEEARNPRKLAPVLIAAGVRLPRRP
jgi:hypothetical protein